MKKTLVIIAHPFLAEKSVVNSAWRDAAQSLSHVTIHDIGSEYPEGVIDVAREQRLVEEHERIIFQFPLWWYAAPAILKQWFDTVVADGWAYGAGGDKMERKEIGVAVSCGGGENDFSETGTQRHTVGHYMDVFDGIAAFVRGVYIGYHTIYGTYKPDIHDRLPSNCQAYIEFLQRT